ncbi:MAG: site-specific integrase [Bacteroidota bacterium]
MDETPNAERPDGFEHYLARLGLSVATAQSYARSVARLSAWLREDHLTPETATYRNVLAWVRSLDVGPKTRNGMLTAVRHYMAHLVAEGKRADNPARGLVVRGERRRLPHDLLSAERLAAIYSDYRTGSPARQRNKATLGLLVYQALHVHEIALLDADDVDLEGGLVSVPGSRIADGRVLWLDGRQVHGLAVYLTESRPALLAATGKETARLFLSAGTGARLSNAVAVLMRELRRTHPDFRDAKQLRASRLALWLRTEHVREVQHRAGHRYVSSTERYRAQDLDRLQSALDKHHPLR